MLKSSPEKGSGLPCDPKHQPANKDFLFAPTHSEQSSLVTTGQHSVSEEAGQVRERWQHPGQDSMALSANCQEGEALSCLPEGQRIAKYERLSVAQEEKVTVFPPFLFHGLGLVAHRLWT